MDATEISQFIQSSKSKNTAYKIKSDIGKFKQYIGSNFPEESDKDLVDISPAKLDTILQNFYIQASRANGEEYEPTTMKGFQCSIDRHLRGNGYGYSIIRSQEFQHSVSVLKCQEDTFET